MAVYNGEKYIKEAIESVLMQTYSNWELIIVNDGSNDRTLDILSTFDDAKIFIYSQENRGVSTARNKGLQKMKGDFFCFLDADDVLPPGSVAYRIRKFEYDPDLSFVDGTVEYKNEDLSVTINRYTPSFSGYPYNRLLKLDESCMFGNTWMIKRDKSFTYQFNENLKHAEDLYFYMSISKGKRYDYVEEPILYYRRSGHSAMNNIKGLQAGYIQLYKLVKEKEKPPAMVLFNLKLKIMKIMFLSFLFDNKSIKLALKSVAKIIAI